MKAQQQKVYEAILSGYRTAREVSIGTGMTVKRCSADLVRLQEAGKVEHTGWLKYPAERWSTKFYEPVL